MSTEAWLLHKSPSGDTSARLSLFTYEKGIITCLYKGARTLKKQALLQPFLSLWLSLDKSKDWYFLRHIESNAAPLIFKGHALFAALYINELTYYALKPFDPHPKLYEKYQYTLQGLSVVQEPLALEALLRSFEWIVLQECGQTLAMAENVTPNTYYRFRAGDGFISADSGLLLHEVIAIIDGTFTEVDILKAAKPVMRQAIHYLLGGRELKSRSLFKSPRLSMGSDSP